MKRTIGSWESARKRAQKEGTTMNQVLTELLTGFASGVIARPQHLLKFEPQTPEARGQAD